MLLLVLVPFSCGYSFGFGGVVVDAGGGTGGVIGVGDVDGGVDIVSGVCDVINGCACGVGVRGVSGVC